MTAVGGGGSIRSGDKVPVATKTGAQAETTYLDVGVDIDCGSLQETQGKLAISVKADISAAQSDTSRVPLIRHIRWSSNLVLPLRKATVLFASDDNSSRRRTQLELTAVPVN